MRRYATLCGLAGVDPYDARAAAAGLPPVDSLDMWPMLSGAPPPPAPAIALTTYHDTLCAGANATSPRTSFPVSANTLVSGDWKYMQGTHSDAGWTAAMYPNASSPARGNDPYVVSLKCGTGPAACLFNVSGDASEHADVASQYPAVAQALAAQLAAAKAAFFTNNESYPWACPPGVDPADCACWMANNRYGGFVGPFQL
jgi:arylsulfatase I/J